MFLKGYPLEAKTASLPGKALRTLVDIARLAELFNIRSVNLLSKDATLVFYLSV